MSAIVGICYFNGQPVDSAALDRMVQALAHRGPDGAGVWRSGAIGLGHRMLWSTPESLHEKLPLVSKTGDLVLTADARIDNRDELLTSLGWCDRPSREITDSELILAAYEKWGELCPAKLLGDFAFAIWDGRNKKLFCARDPMGVKPFYYYHSGHIFAFASEIKAVLSLKEVPCRLNEVKVVDFLVPIFEDRVITFYQNIFRLPPAHTMTVNRDGVLARLYWSLDPLRELRLGSDEEYAEAFREIFTEAVRCRLRSALPVGSALSGGLDSSSIACTASKLLQGEGNGRLHTFSAIFPSVVEQDPRIDERRYMEAVLAIGGFEAHYVHADRFKPVAETLTHKDEAVPATTLYMDRALFSAAHEQGIRVLLSGFDGDSTVSYGLEYLEELACIGRWADFAKEVHAIGQHTNINPLSYVRAHGLEHLTRLARTGRWLAFAKHANEISKYFDLSRWNIVLNAGLKPLAPEFIRRSWRLLRGRSPLKWPEWTVNRAINPAFSRRMRLKERVQAFQAHNSTSAFNAREEHIRGLTSGLLQYGVEILDQVAATFSMEQRYPFFDRRLMEFCLALPFEQKLHQGWTRAILRRAMDNILPFEVQWRTQKANLGTNFRLRLFEEQETLAEVIFKDFQMIEEYVDMAALRSAYHRFVSQPVLSEPNDSLTVFLAVTLGSWLHRSALRPT